MSENTGMGFVKSSLDGIAIVSIDVDGKKTDVKLICHASLDNWRPVSVVVVGAKWPSIALVDVMIDPLKSELETMIEDYNRGVTREAYISLSI